MKKIVVIGLFGALALAVPAQATHHSHPSTHGTHRCKPHRAGYYAVGTLVNAALTKDANGHGRYSGTLEVDVTRANHRGAKGDQIFTLSHARVRFHHGVDSSAPAAGSRVKLHGKITQLSKRCPTDGFTPTVSVKKVDLRPAKHKA